MKLFSMTSRNSFLKEDLAWNFALPSISLLSFVYWIFPFFSPPMLDLLNAAIEIHTPKWWIYVVCSLKNRQVVETLMKRINFFIREIRRSPSWILTENSHLWTCENKNEKQGYRRKEIDISHNHYLSQLVFPLRNIWLFIKLSWYLCILTSSGHPVPAFIILRVETWHSTSGLHSASFNFLYSPLLSYPFYLLCFSTKE